RLPGCAKVKRLPAGEVVMATVRVKICGITSEADAATAATLGADAIGLNFYPKSARYVPPEAAAPIGREPPPFVRPVALFVNQPLAVAFEAARRLGPVCTVQWHGEQPETCSETAVRFIPAFQVCDADGLERVRRYLDLCRELDRLPAAVL